MHAFRFRVSGYAPLLLPIAVCLSGCTAPSEFDEAKLASVRKIALVDVSGQLLGSANDEICSRHVESFAESLDVALKENGAVAWIPFREVAGDPARKTLKGGAENPWTRRRLLEALQVDALLEAEIWYRVSSSSAGYSLNAYPKGKLYAEGQAEPIWTYTGGSSQFLPKTLVITKSASERLKGIAHDAAEQAFPLALEDGPSDPHLAALMAEFHRQGALADWAAAKLGDELLHAIRVSRGEQSAHFLALARAGLWGRLFEWKPMGASGLMLVAFLAMFVVVGLVGQKLHPARKAFAPADPFEYRPARGEEDPDQYSKAGLGCLGLISVIGSLYSAYYFLKATF